MIIPAVKERPALIPAGSSLLLRGDLSLTGEAGLVLFAHGSGSGRFSPRNRQAARLLNEAGLSTLLFDLLTEDEEDLDRRSYSLRFDIPLLARRVLAGARWLKSRPETKNIPLGFFGTSTGAAAALMAAAEAPAEVFAVVSRGGRPDLAGEFLPRVKAPTLFIVGEKDEEVLALNRRAAKLIKASCRLEVVPGASHLFEEEGTLEKAARLAADWFLKYHG